MINDENVWIPGYCRYDSIHKIKKLSIVAIVVNKHA